MEIKLLFTGMPVRCSRGNLGWSTVALIRTGELNLLFDTAGLNERLVMEAQLLALGLPADQINIIVLSHLHYDHAMNYTLFPQAEVIVGRKELEFANSLEGMSDPFVPPGIAEQIKHWPKLRLVDDGDKLAEGLTIFHTPGHTPGGISLLTENLERNMLIGDAIKNGWEFVHGLPEATQEWRETLKKIKAAGNFFIPGHDRPFWCDNSDSITYKGSASVDIIAHFSPHTSTRNILSLRVDDEKLWP